MGGNEVLWNCLFKHKLSIPLLLLDLGTRSHDFDINTVEKRLTVLLELGSCALIDGLIYDKEIDGISLSWIVPADLWPPDLVSLNVLPTLFISLEPV